MPAKKKAAKPKTPKTPKKEPKQASKNAASENLQKNKPRRNKKILMTLRV